MTQSLFHFLSSVPDVIWSGVLASVLTLGGVLIANRSNTTRLRIQLQHDSSEKTRERHATLRREVYLKTVEELTKASSHLATLPQKDPLKENLGEGVQGFAVAVAKLQLIAEPKTALLANELAAAYGALTVRLLGKAMPLQEIRTDIAIQDDLCKQAQDQVKRVLAEMVTFNESGETDRRRWEALQRSFDGFSSQAAKHAADRARGWEAFNRGNAEFSKQLISDLRSIGYMQIPVLVEVRRELGLTTELDVIQQQMEKQWSLMSAELAGVFQKLDGQLHEQVNRHGRGACLVLVDTLT